MKNQDTNTLKEYTFLIQDIVKNQESKQCLQKYLDKEMNGESLMFLEAMEELESHLQRDGTEKQIMTHVDPILTKFFTQGPFELNVSASEKQALFDFFTSINTESELNDQIVLKAFSPIKSIVEQEMTYDVLPRFLRSKEWMDLVTKHGASFVKKVGRHRKAIEMNFSDDDFKDPVIDDTEFEFFYKLQQDNYDWKLVGFDKTQKIMAFNSKRILEYFPKVSWLAKGGTCTRYIGILPFSFELCERYLFQAQVIAAYDKNISSQKTMQYFSAQELAEKYPDKKISEGRSSGILQYMVYLGFPFGVRPCNQVYSGYYNAKKHEAVSIAKPYIPDGGTTCEMKDIIVYTLRKIDEERTLFSQIHICNLGSFSANKLAGLVVYQRAKQLSKGMTKYLKKRAHLPLPEKNYSDGIMRTYLDYKEKESHIV